MRDLSSSARCLLFVISLFGGAYVIRRVGDSTAYGLEGYKQGNRRRTVAIWRLLWIMAHLSVFVYLHLFSVFRPSAHPKEEKGRKNKTPVHPKYKQRALVLFWIVIVAAHLSYVLYTVDARVPAFLFDFTNICGGIWLHLVFFSGGFLAVGVIVRFLKLFALGNSFLECVFRFRPLEALATDCRVQVASTLFLSALLCLAQFIASDKLVVREATFPLRNWKSTTPLRVALLSDLHAGASVYREHIERVVAKVNEIHDQHRLDAVVLVGDTIDAPRHLIEERVAPLQFLRPRALMVSGNHEYYYGEYKKWTSLFTSYGIEVLTNQVADLNATCIVGLSDLSSNKSGIANESMRAEAMAECPASNPIIVLAHNPAASKEILQTAGALNKHVDLILSGHTHAGQYYIIRPFVYWLLPYLYKTYQLETGTNLLVSAGTLWQAAPMKMPFHSEIWILTLKAAV